MPRPMRAREQATLGRDRRVPKARPVTAPTKTYEALSIQDKFTPRQFSHTYDTVVPSGVCKTQYSNVLSCAARGSRPNVFPVRQPNLHSERVRILGPELLENECVRKAPVRERGVILVEKRRCGL